MRFIDLTTKYNITQDRIKIAIGTVSILLVSAIALIGVKTLLDAEARADRQRRLDEAAGLLVGASQTSETDPLISRELDAVAVAEPTDETSEETTESDESSETTDEEENSSTEEYIEVTTTQETTTATTTAGISETPVYMTVYATQSINLRTGPGTDYSVVRTLNPGDAIDVIAQTSNGWYKTYNGNYVLASYTQSTPIATAPQVPATQGTTAAATQATTTRAPSGSVNNCTITFYGPQPRGDGTYSTTTATGTTCQQGRTCAADWSIYPAGTVIYIENDPLGGDGYYTVEDRGPGVQGYHIDIYVDSTSGWNTTSRNVSVG